MPREISVGPTAPVAPQQGNLWWRTDPDGNLYIYYNDGNSTQWVPATSLLNAAPAGPAGGSLAGSYPNPSLASNAVTWASISDPVYARVQSTAAQTLPNSTWTVVTFGGVVTNVGGVWTAPDHFTIPISGFYLIGGNVQFDGNATAGWRQLAIVNQSGTQIAYELETSSGFLIMQLTTAMYLTAGTTLTLQANQNSGTTVQIGLYGATSLFWIARVA